MLRSIVGRSRELAELTHGLESALSGRGSLYLISGDPGIGKSRLTDEIAEMAGEKGLLVLWGRCWEAGGAPAYWPWVQSLRAYIRQVDPETLARQLGDGAPYIAPFLPEVRDIVRDVPEPLSLESDAARFRLFDATGTFLVNASLDRPLAILLDDLHAADEPSLLLLEFVARQLTEARIFMLGAHRDVDGEPGLPLASTLSELARAPATRRLHLEGLEVDDVRDFIELTTAVEVAEPLASAIHDRTEGNPLFVQELTRLLIAEGRLGQIELPAERLVIPEGVREVINWRLRQVSDECSEMLAVAAVIGREFSIELLRRASGHQPEVLLRILDEASRARVVLDGAGGSDRFRFSHVLLRDAIYDRLPIARRIELHRLVGEALEGLPGADPPLASLAHHFFAAAPGGDAAKAVDYARQAAERAVGLLAFEEAVRLYRTALRAMDLGDQDDEARCRLVMALGDAQARAGDHAASRETFEEAAALAKRLGLAEQLGRAALGYGGRFVWARGFGDPRLVPLLREALAALPEEEDTDLRARLMARLAGALRDEHDPAPREQLSAKAVAMAIRIGDPATLAYALDGRFAAVYGPGGFDVRLPLIDELGRAARAAGDLERAADVHLYRFWALFEMGDMPGAYQELDELAGAVAELRQPAQSWGELVTRAHLSLFEGRLEEAERLIDEAAKAGERGEYNSTVSQVTQTFALRKEQGRLEETREAVEAIIARFPTRPLFRCLLASLHAELGQRAEASRIFEALAADEFAGLPQDPEWTLELSLLVEVADFLGDSDRAETLYELFRPYEELMILDPNEFSTGGVPRYLGILASLMGRWDDASKHFEDALEMNERMGGRPWVAHTRYDYARMLVARDGPGDRDRALELLSAAHQTAADLGMAMLERKAREMFAELGAEAPEGASEIAAEPVVSTGSGVFRREGEYFAIAYEGDAFRLKDTKGLRYLEHLLANPGREVHAIDLALVAEGRLPPSPGVLPRKEAGHDAGPEGDAGEVLDPEARAAYARRLEELQEEVDEAESFGDGERAARAKEEMEFLTRELAGATGLGGRARRSASPAERARVNVTKAIKVALGRVAEHSPSLGHHLDSTIRTGTFCSYTPDPRAPVAWRT